jgi:hypothetical protein
MKNRPDILLIGVFIIISIIPACEKDDDDNNSETLNYRPTQITYKMNGEYTGKETFTFESDKLKIHQEYDIEFGITELDKKNLFEYQGENTIIKDIFDMTADPPDNDFRYEYKIIEDKISEIIVYMKGLFTDEWELLARNLFTYSGNLVSEEKDYWYEEDTWKIYSRKTYDYQDKKVIDAKTFNYDDQGVEEPRWDADFEYDGSKLKQVITTYQGITAYKYIPEYDGDRMISSTTYGWESGSWISWYKDEYEYDAKGNCTRVKEYFFETGEEYLTETTYEEGKSNYSLLIEWPGSVRMY